jgi:hypothetical protein
MPSRLLLTLRKLTNFNLIESDTNNSILAGKPDTITILGRRR